MRLHLLGLTLLLCAAGAWAQDVAQTPPSPAAKDPAGTPALSTAAKRKTAKAASKAAAKTRAAKKVAAKAAARTAAKARAAKKMTAKAASKAAAERTKALRATYLEKRGALRAKDRFQTLETLLGDPAGRWWIRPELARWLGLAPEQQKKMDDIFQQHRIELIDRNAAVQKEEAAMEPLVSADQPDESKILSQIEKLALARAELEQANARMLLGIRRVLTPEQWRMLKSGPSPRQK